MRFTCPTHAIHVSHALVYYCISGISCWILMILESKWGFLRSRNLLYQPPFFQIWKKNQWTTNFTFQYFLPIEISLSALWQFLLKRPGSADRSGVKTTYTLFYTILNQDSLISLISSFQKISVFGTENVSRKRRNIVRMPSSSNSKRRRMFTPIGKVCKLRLGGPYMVP